eukprot:1938154-Amphidinium_carterae.1
MSGSEWLRICSQLAEDSHQRCTNSVTRKSSAGYNCIPGLSLDRDLYKLIPTRTAQGWTVSAQYSNENKTRTISSVIREVVNSFQRTPVVIASDQLEAGLKNLTSNA